MARRKSPDLADWVRALSVVPPFITMPAGIICYLVLHHFSMKPVVVGAGPAGAWAAYRLAEARATRLAVPAAVTLWVVYMSAFVLWARLLVGWNNSVPWHPRSTTWMTTFAVSAPIVAAIAQVAGTRAAARAGAKVATEAVPHE